MKTKVLSTSKLLMFLLIVGLPLTYGTVRTENQLVQAAMTDSVCRFGITAPYSSEGYGIADIGVGSFLDWGAASNPALPEGMEYIRVLRVRDDLYQQVLANLPTWVQENPGGIWLVGNESDTRYENQDALEAEVYAERYYALASIIRGIDATAKIGFGSIVQPTPIRMRYLDRAWDKLNTITDDANVTSGLIDIWSIHAFILNEQPYSWGTGIPPGFENDYDDAITITVTDTYSIDIFQQRILSFRSWMADKGERDKPLWITEYGSLLPPIDPPGGPNYYNLSDRETANFMTATFAFMLSADDDQNGYPADNNRLVQRWFWYSLNDHRYHFGGSLFDPDQLKLPTLVGEEFMNYRSLSLADPDLFPVDLSASPLTYNRDRTRVNYRLDLKIGNAITADTSTGAQAWIYDGDPNAGGSLIAGPIPAETVQRCGGDVIVSADWMNIEPLTYHTFFVSVNPVDSQDSNPDNNWKSFTVYLDVPKISYLPSVYR